MSLQTTIPEDSAEREAPAAVGASDREPAGGTPAAAPTKKRATEKLKKMFTAKRLALMAVFTALAYVASFLEFSLFPSASFLKLDFGNVFIMLIGFLLGPVEGVVVCALKEILRIPLGSTGGVGELANMIVTSSFILLPSVVYKFRKGLNVVAPAMAAACFIATGTALLANRFILFPAFGIPTKGFYEVWGLILAFNLIKTVFAKGVAKGMGIFDEVTSPTYAYMNDYDGRLFHYDCYRIQSPRQAENLGLADYFELGGVCLVEWSENIAPLLPERLKRVKIRKIDENTREIEY